MKRKFWNWIQNQDESGSEMRTLFLNGEISDETWYGDEVTPKIFKDELNMGKGPISVWINSPGGDVFAAAQIYNMLMDYPYDVTVKIDGLAASAASVIAMAGTTVEMSPVAMMMIHNPATIAIGDSEEMKKAVKMLDEVKESIMNAYEIKTGLARDKISKLMDAESWFNAIMAGWSVPRWDRVMAVTATARQAAIAPALYSQVRLFRMGCCASSSKSSSTAFIHF